MPPCLAAAPNRRVVGWYNGYPSLDNVPWSTYTHVRYGAPHVAADGTATCNRSAQIADVAHAHGVRVLWAPNVDAAWITEGTTPAPYWRTIGRAMGQCDIDGIEVDYEHTGKWGIVTPEASTRYSHWLAQLRRVTGKPVSADISLPGLAPGNWILANCRPSRIAEQFFRFERAKSICIAHP